MGKLIDGVWHVKDPYFKESKAFDRKPSVFRQHIGDPAFPAEAGRYHLYVSYACPWAHRTLIARALLGLEDAISFSAVDPYMLDNGWEFTDGYPDDLYGSSALWQIYVKSDPKANTRVTVPVLWDKKTETIVNNESSEILRMFNGPMRSLGHGKLDIFPEPHRTEIEKFNAVIYPNLNNGVYRSGFARGQEAYEAAVADVFRTLDMLEDHLAGKQWLVGNELTEADIRLWTTLLRFDPVYVGHFKCNWRMLHEYPNLWRYTKAFLDVPGVRPTVRMDHIKNHYYGSHPWLNPSGVVPTGPILDWDL